jgi:hypothetical protein
MNKVLILLFLYITHQVEFEYNLKPMEMRCVAENLRDQILGIFNKLSFWENLFFKDPLYGKSI